MSLRIRAHVNYGTKTPAAVVVQPIAKAKRVHAPRRPRPSHDVVYDWLRAYAVAGYRAPTRTEIRARFGASANVVMKELCRNGRISLEIGQRNYRVISLGDIKTQGFPEGVRAYRKINQFGDFWFINGSWVKR